VWFNPNLFQVTINCVVLNTGENLSYHLPIIVQFRLNPDTPDVNCAGGSEKSKHDVRLRCDKADLVIYYYTTMLIYLQSMLMFNCQLGCGCDRKLYIGWAMLSLLGMFVFRSPLLAFTNFGGIRDGQKLTKKLRTYLWNHSHALIIAFWGKRKKLELVGQKFN